MTKFTYVFGVFLFALTVPCFADEPQATDRPNIVLIMADDLGLGDVNYYQKKFQAKKSLVPTPAMDALAKDGMWFTDAHSATALCSPTRYCVMSGNMNYRSYAPWGVWGSFRESPFKPGEATLGSVAKSAGYATGFVGKWHLGGDFLDSATGEIYRKSERNDPNTTVDMTKMVGGGPPSIGFDYSLTLPCGIQGPSYTVYENGNWLPLKDDSKIIFLDKKTAIDPKFVSDKGPGPGDSNWDAREIGKLLSSKAVDFVNDHASKDPFFLCYWSPHVHLPHTPTTEFDGLKIAGTTPSNHLDTVRDFDQQVARIVKSLKANNVYDNTLIIFTSDNGGLGVGASIKAGHDSSGEWRGYKNAAHEGGHRVPFVAVWPGKIKPASVSDEPVINQDVLATMASLLDVKVPADQAKDSLNLLPLLTGNGEFKQREYIMMQAGSKNEVMFRKDGWKLILQSDHKVSKFEPIALFNLNDNPAEDEKQNWVNDPEQAERVKAMRDQYIRIRTSGERTTPAVQS
ncbi:sulfatase family protein [Rubripirellula reticaptiva]|uniref:Arylsulfatase n=1 Tax=Rubripirellula reticaptiva TaxID=2528013 RepID=A0A5C6F7W6_9BACT|nr:arylsulfatase [Rubripirellula reticaptiva]TWU55591.1 Arylsulfatase [Rubripirellula reticaptiva]